jgi:hypothetical protein
MTGLLRQCLQQVLCIILFNGIVKAEVFQCSSRSFVRTSGKSPPIHYRLVARGGAQSADNNDDDYDSDSSPPARDNQRPRRDQQRQRPPQHPPPPPPKSTFASLAEKSYALTTHALSATARQSGKAAYYLIRPKKVKVKELFGLWRMDQSMMLYDDDDDEPESSSTTIEVTPAGTILLPRNSNGDGDGGSNENQSRYTFTPAHLTASAKLEWRQQQYFYKAYIHRKVADSSVIKLKGKIYRVDHTGWRGKTEKLVPVGTFVARRRLKLLPDQDEEEDEEDEETMDEEEDWGDQSDDGYDVGNDVLAEEEEYDDQDEDY